MAKSNTTKAAPKTATKSQACSLPHATHEAENKTDKLIALLKREIGATLTDITGATDWLPHSARAMLTGLRKKGFTLEKTKVEGMTRYTITGDPA